MPDHFISIGESIHASIPKTGNVMKKLAQLGPEAYNCPSEPLDYITEMIQSQADDGADYIAVNVDAFGENDPQIAVDMMVEYVKLVRKWGKTVPICIDSSDDNILIAGLKECYNTDQKPAQPLINSVKVYNMDKIFALKKDYDYAFVGLLMNEAGRPHSIDELYDLAKQIFEHAVNNYSFKPGEIFFDTTIFPLAIDMPMQPGEKSFTHKTFQTIRKIKSDPRMKGVHFSGGITNCARDLPARKIGVMRAYVHKAIEYGLDAGIVNVKHRLHQGQADPQLLKLVEAFAQMDGSPEKTADTMMLMGKFCRENRKE